MNVLRSIGAVIGGFLVLAILSTVMDTVLEKTIWPGLAHADASTGV